MSDTPDLCYCGQSLALRDVEAARAARWQRTRLTWRVTTDLPGFARAAFEAAITEAFTAWQAVCGLTFARLDGPADLNISTGRVDGPLGVLAYAELPDGSDRPLRMVVDTSEQWVVNAQGQRGPIDLVAVLTHEIGHLIGLDHNTSGGNALMNSHYSPGIRKPQALDVQRAVGLYGPPVMQPPPVPMPTPGGAPAGGEPIVIRIHGAQLIEIPGYSVKRIV